ncbi:MAG: hypothetical protein AABX38_03665 [Candidatus Micrarchaeota archaeon]
MLHSTKDSKGRVIIREADRAKLIDLLKKCGFRNITESGPIYTFETIDPFRSQTADGKNVENGTIPDTGLVLTGRKTEGGEKLSYFSRFSFSRPHGVIDPIEVLISINRLPFRLAREYQLNDTLYVTYTLPLTFHTSVEDLNLSRVQALHLIYLLATLSAGVLDLISTSDPSDVQIRRANSLMDLSSLNCKIRFKHNIDEAILLSNQLGLRT